MHLAQGCWIIAIAAISTRCPLGATISMPRFAPLTGAGRSRRSREATDLRLRRPKTYQRRHGDSRLHASHLNECRPSARTGRLPSAARSSAAHSAHLARFVQYSQPGKRWEPAGSADASSCRGTPVSILMAQSDHQLIVRQPVMARSEINSRG